LVNRPEADVADRFAAEALFQLSTDFGFGDLFELVMQSWLEHADVKQTFAKCDRGRVRGDEVADDLCSNRRLPRNGFQ